MYRNSWTGRGSLRPNFSLRAASTSGVAFRSLVKGPPGTACIRQKVSTMMASMAASIMPRRLAKYLTMGAPPYYGRDPL